MIEKEIKQTREKKKYIMTEQVNERMSEQEKKKNTE
jgi:hypothetical protein